MLSKLFSYLPSSLRFGGQQSQPRQSGASRLHQWPTSPPLLLPELVLRIAHYEPIDFVNLLSTCRDYAAYRPYFFAAHQLPNGNHNILFWDLASSYLKLEADDHDSVGLCGVPLTKRQSNMCDYRRMPMRVLPVSTTRVNDDFSPASASLFRFLRSLRGELPRHLKDNMHSNMVTKLYRRPVGFKIKMPPKRYKDGEKTAYYQYIKRLISVTGCMDRTYEEEESDDKTPLNYIFHANPALLKLLLPK